MSDFKKNVKKKKRICVSVDEDKAKKAQEQNLNVSAICNEALRLALAGKLKKVS